MLSLIIFSHYTFFTVAAVKGWRQNGATTRIEKSRAIGVYHIVMIRNTMKSMDKNETDTKVTGLLVCSALCHLKLSDLFL